MEPEPNEENIVNVLARAREEVRTEYQHRLRHVEDPHENAELRRQRMAVLEDLTSAIRAAGGDPADVEAIQEALAREGP